MALTSIEMLEIANSVKNDLGDPTIADAYTNEPENFEWVYYDSLSWSVIQELAEHAGFNSPSEAREWLESEIEMLREDELIGIANDYESMLSGKESVKEPVVCGNGLSDGYWLWDGTHRIAAVYANGGSLSGIVGHAC